MRKILLQCVNMMLLLTITACSFGKTAKPLVETTEAVVSQMQEENLVMKIDNEIESDILESREDVDSLQETIECVNKDDSIFPNSSEKLLQISDIIAKSKDELRFGRNEIYARHGRRFNSPELQDYFDKKAWYHGDIFPNEFNEGCLSDIEKQNINFLMEIEKNIGIESNNRDYEKYSYKYSYYSTGEYVKENNTDTIELIRIDDDTICGIYRGTSSGCEWSEKEGEKLFL